MESIKGGSDYHEKQLEINAIRKDIATARRAIDEARTRYVKQCLRLRNIKAGEGPFAELFVYNSRKEIRDAYEQKLIPKAEMERLKSLWDTRERSLAAAQYEDRVTQFLRQAMNAVGEEYTEQLLAFQELERRMGTDTERIAMHKQRQREWRQEYGDGVPGD